MDPTTSTGTPEPTTRTDPLTTTSPTLGAMGPSGGDPPSAGAPADGALDKAKAAVSDTAAEVKDQARDIVGEARGQLRDRAEDGTRQLGGTLRSASEELHQMAGATSGGSLASDVTAQLAGGLGRVADRIDEGGMQSVLDDVERYARRHPGRFLLGAMAAGFAVGRLVQHSDTSGLRRAMQDGMSGDGGSGDGGSGSIDLTGTGRLTTPPAPPLPGTATPAGVGAATSPTTGFGTSASGGASRPSSVGPLDSSGLPGGAP
jgi:hypothetical protein